MKFCTLILISSFSLSAFASTYDLECTPSAEPTLNRFTLSGEVELSSKGEATAQFISISTQMAGRDSLVTEFSNIEMSGSSHTYTAGVLGADEVTSLRVIGSLGGRVTQLSALSGLLGPESALSIQGIPFRAECKLK